MSTNFNAWALGLSLSAEASIALAASVGVDLPVRDFVLAGGKPEELRRRMDNLSLNGGARPLPIDWRRHAAVFMRDLQRLPRCADGGGGPRPAPDRDVGPARDARSARFGRRPRGAPRRGRQAARPTPGRDRPGPGPVRDSAGTRGHRSRVIPYRAQGLPFVHRLANFDRVLGAVWGGAPNLEMLLDGFHLDAAGEEIEAGLAWRVEKIVNVHVAAPPTSTRPDRRAVQDKDRGLPGDNGTIDSQRLLARLAEQGHDGPITNDRLQPADATRLQPLWRKRSTASAGPFW